MYVVNKMQNPIRVKKDNNSVWNFVMSLVMYAKVNNIVISWLDIFKNWYFNKKNLPIETNFSEKSNLS